MVGSGWDPEPLRVTSRVEAMCPCGYAPSGGHWAEQQDGGPWVCAGCHQPIPEERLPGSQPAVGTITVASGWTNRPVARQPNRAERRARGRRRKSPTGAKLPAR